MDEQTWNWLVSIGSNGAGTPTYRYKVGDRVRYLISDDELVPLGSVGTVTSVDLDTDLPWYFRVQWDGVEPYFNVFATDPDELFGDPMVEEEVEPV